MFRFRESALLCVAEHVTARFMLGKSQPCLTYVVLQPSRNKYFSYFPSSTVGVVVLFCIWPQHLASFPLGLFLTFTQFDKRNRLFQITSLLMKSLVSISLPLVQDVQSHQKDLKKNNKFFKSLLASQAENRFMNGKHAHAFEHTNHSAGSKHPALPTCVNPSANIIQ